ncbi:MAG TPA: SprT family zinc-dependent metalloprotease [Longilinea sp.]|nr:SprT family zinc-dependent metalloprotease [Longilinea sp.]
MKIDQIIYSRRKTLALIVRADGTLLVRAPQRANRLQIVQFVESKTDWIRRTQEKIKRLPPPAPARQYKPGESFLYLGKSYRLEIVDKATTRLSLKDRFYLSKKSLPSAPTVFTAWYKRRAREVLTARVQQYAAQLGLKVSQVKITSARTRWGSCSAKGNLSFTWRLVMAPPPVIDYVVVHELAHLRERNHSKRFWSLVQSYMPDYKTRQDWLKRNGAMLTL